VLFDNATGGGVSSDWTLSAAVGGSSAGFTSSNTPAVQTANPSMLLVVMKTHY